MAPSLSNDRNVLMHEMGHAVANLRDKYCAGSWGPPYDESAWDLYMDPGPRLNIWTIPNEFGGFTEKRDVPEHDSSLNNSENDMGPRYFELMGCGQYPNSWPGADTYRAFIYSLINWFR